MRTKEFLDRYCSSLYTHYLRGFSLEGATQTKGTVSMDHTHLPLGLVESPFLTPHVLGFQSKDVALHFYFGEISLSILDTLGDL